MNRLSFVGGSVINRIFFNSIVETNVNGDSGVPLVSSQGKGYFPKVKALFTRTVDTLLRHTFKKELYDSFCNVALRHFSLDPKDKVGFHHTASLGKIAFFNILQGIITGGKEYTSVKMIETLGEIVFAEEEMSLCYTTAALRIGTVGACFLGLIFMDASVSRIKNRMMCLLSASLIETIRDKCWKDILENGYLGNRLKPQELVPETILLWDLENTCYSLPYLFNTRLRVITKIVVASLSLWSIGTQYSLEFLGYNINVLILIAAVYSLSSGYFMTKNYNKFLNNYHTKGRIFSHKANYVSHSFVNGKSAVLQDEKPHLATEYNKISYEGGGLGQNTLPSMHETKLENARIASQMSFSEIVTSWLSEYLAIVATALCRVPFSYLISIRNHFNRFLEVITWFIPCAENLCKLRSGATRVEKLIKDVEDWIDLRKQSKLTRIVSEDVIFTGTLKLVKLKEGELKDGENPYCLENKKVLINAGVDKEGEAIFNLKKGGKYRLEASSGQGKSTLISALMGGEPGLEGTLCCPAKVYAVAQKPYMPNGVMTLAKFVGVKEETDFEEIGALLDRLKCNFRLDKNPKGTEICGKDSLSIERNWFESVSGGQLAKLGLVRMILKAKYEGEPGLVLLDEVTSPMSEGDQEIVEKIILEYFPNTTILSIIHKPKEWTTEENGRSNFYDEVIEIKKDGTLSKRKHMLRTNSMVSINVNNSNSDQSNSD